MTNGHGGDALSRGQEGEAYIGRALRRGEDLRFLIGEGQYTDDIVLPQTVFAAFVRSPHAHARLERISVDRAKQLPGVLSILTAADWEAAKLGSLPCLHPVPSQDGKPMNEVTRPIFCDSKVRYVGDNIAAVIAETAHQAQDAAEAIEIEYSVLPSVVDPAEALAPGAPILHEEFGTNLVHWVEHGDQARTTA